MATIDGGNDIKFSELKAAYVAGGGSGADNHSELTNGSTTSAISLSHLRNSGFADGTSVPSSGAISIGSLDGKTFGSPSTLNYDSIAQATISNSIYTRHGYTGQQGYVSRALYPASAAGYARIEYKITNAGASPPHNPNFIGLIPSTDSPTVTGNYQWPKMYTINYLTGNARVVYPSYKFNSTGIAVTSDDLLSITYDSGTITFAKNGTSIGYQVTGLATNIVFHAKIECYIYSSGGQSTERLEYHDVNVYDGP